MIEDLVQRIQEESDQIKRAKGLAEKRWKKAFTDPDYLGSVTLDLLNFYSGIERVFEIIAKDLDGRMPKNGEWHRKLLDQMASEIQAIRPALLSSETRILLDEFRKFRHLARTIYSFHLNPEKIKALIIKLPKSHKLFQRDLKDFIDNFLLQHDGTVDRDITD
jgi:hypothetical protein